MFDFDPNKQLVAYLVRHGELVNMRCWDGWGSFELSLEGHRQAEQAAQWLSFDHIGRIISSDVPRTLQTAQYLMNTGTVLCPFMGTDPNLRPWNVGIFTGKEKTPERVAEFSKYCEDPTLVVPEGESRQQFNDRVQVIYQYAMVPYKGLPTVFFVHNSVIKSLMGIDDIKDACSPGGVVGMFMDECGKIFFEILLGKVETEIGVS
jgi:broad specificity phosphatase PhoE